MWSTYLDSDPGHGEGQLEAVSSARRVSQPSIFYYVTGTHGTIAYLLPAISHFHHHFVTRFLVKISSLVHIAILLV